MLPWWSPAKKRSPPESNATCRKRIVCPLDPRWRDLLWLIFSISLYERKESLKPICSVTFTKFQGPFFNTIFLKTNDRHHSSVFLVERRRELLSWRDIHRFLMATRGPLFSWAVPDFQLTPLPRIKCRPNPANLLPYFMFSHWIKYFQNYHQVWKKVLNYLNLTKFGHLCIETS